MIGKYLDCSTTHITKEDSEKLTNSEYSSCKAPLVSVYEHGFIVYVPNSLEINEVADSMLVDGYSQSFVNLLKYAEENNVTLIRLDGDGDIIKELHENKW